MEKRWFIARMIWMGIGMGKFLVHAHDLRQARPHADRVTVRVQIRYLSRHV
jgi:hypothetical protein